MPTEFIIERSFSHHSGGTKCYQVWRIGILNAWVNVHQWGKSSVMFPGGGVGGDVKVLPFATRSLAVSDYQKIIQEKGKRGYDKWTHETISCGLAQVNAKLKEIFGTDRASLIIKNLALDDMQEETDEPIAPPNKGKPEEPVDRGPAWGSW